MRGLAKQLKFLKKKGMIDMGVKEEIVLQAQRMRGSKARLAAIVAEENGDGMRLTYIYDLNGKLRDYQYFLLPHEQINSISDIYTGALNMEREIVDLFGLEINGAPPELLLVEKSKHAPLRKNL